VWLNNCTRLNYHASRAVDLNITDTSDPAEHCIKLEKLMVFPSSLADRKAVRYLSSSLTPRCAELAFLQKMLGPLAGLSPLEGWYEFRQNWVHQLKMSLCIGWLAQSSSSPHEIPSLLPKWTTERKEAGEDL